MQPATASRRRRTFVTTSACDDRRMAKRSASKKPAKTPLSQVLRVGPGFDLADADPPARPASRAARRRRAGAGPGRPARLSDLQERLTAAAKGGSTRSVLLVVQGMDTGGKGGIVRHVVGACDPEGVRVTAFKVPTPEEREHDFLWRIRNALPPAGKIGVFDRSHYEDVLVVRVHELVPRATWARRYATINRFEAKARRRPGTAIVKVMLHISAKEQKKRRLAERLDSPGQVVEVQPGRHRGARTLWPTTRRPTRPLITKCSTDAGAVARRAGRPQVVRPVGRAAAADRGA